MSGIGVGEVLEGGGVAPQAERGLAAERRLAHAGHRQQAGGRLQGVAHRSARGQERAPRAGVHVGAGKHCERATVVGHGHHAGQRLHAPPSTTTADQLQAHAVVLGGSTPAGGHRRRAQEVRQRGLVVPHGEQGPPSEIGGEAGGAPPSGAHQAEEAQTGRTGQRAAVQAEACQHEGRVCGMLAHEMERRHGSGHDPRCCHVERER
jgi:hypothetical protein